MMAGAKLIHSSGVGFVFLVAVVPSIMIKITGPYWFHLITYKTRMTLVAVLMGKSAAATRQCTASSLLG